MYEEEEYPTIESFYFKVERLGEGGFGFVFSGKDRETGMKVAIKLIPREGYGGRERHEELFRKEFDLIRSMKHENIIEAYPLKEFKNFLLMPMQIGKFSLMKLIKQRFRTKKGFNEEEVA